MPVGQQQSLGGHTAHSMPDLCLCDRVHVLCVTSCASRVAKLQSCEVVSSGAVVCSIKTLSSKLLLCMRTLKYLFLLILDKLTEITDYSRQITVITVSLQSE